MRLPVLRGECDIEAGVCWGDWCRHFFVRADTERAECALRVADEGEHSHRDIAAMLGLSHQRIMQIERDAAAKLRGEKPSRNHGDASPERKRTRVSRSPRLKSILHAVAAGPADFGQIASQVGLTRRQVNTAMKELYQRGEVLRISPGVYVVNELREAA